MYCLQRTLFRLSLKEDLRHILTKLASPCSGVSSRSLCSRPLSLWQVQSLWLGFPFEAQGLHRLPTKIFLTCHLQESSYLWCIDLLLKLDCAHLSIDESHVYWIGLDSLFWKKTYKPLEKFFGFETVQSVRRYHERCKIPTFVLAGFAVFLFLLFILSFQKHYWMAKSDRLAVKIRYSNINNSISQFFLKSARFNRWPWSRSVLKKSLMKSMYLARLFYYHYHASEQDYFLQLYTLIVNLYLLL